MIEVGRIEVSAKTRDEMVAGKGSLVMPMDCMIGIIRMIMGSMKVVINSRRRVKALKSFLMIAASVDEKPSLLSNPVLGV